uniref:Transposase n=1 Tax=Acrobeloides nanus TaxID=290746 RepID=A0A914CCK7_9BILA
MKELRPAIIRMYQNGIPMREISRLLDVPKSTVINDIKCFEETGANEDRAKRLQEPQKTINECEECSSGIQRPKKTLHESWPKN